MAISFVGSGTFSAIDNATPTFNYSSLLDAAGGTPSIAANDFAIAVVAHHSAGDVNLTPPSGWSEEVDIWQSGGINTNLGVFYDVLTGGETSVSFSSSGNGNDALAGAIFVFRGVDTSAPFDVTTTTATGTGTDKPNPPSITPSTAGAWIVCAGGAGTNGTSPYTNPGDLSSTTNHFRSIGGSDTNSALAGMGIKTNWASGAFDPSQWTGASGGVWTWAAATMALRPFSLEATASDGIGVAESLIGGREFSDTVSETVAIDPDLVKSMEALISLGVAVDPDLIAGESVTLTDGFSALHLIAAIRTQSALAEAAIGMSPALTPVYGQVIREQLLIALTDIANHNAQLTLADDVDVAPALTVGVPATVSEGVGVAPTEVVEHVIQIIEQLDLLPVLGPMFVYGQSVAETVGVAEVLARFLGADLSDGIGTQPTLAGVAAKLQLISEGIGVAETLNPQLLISVTAADTIDITVEDALNFIHFGVLSDEIQLSAAYLSPGDGITTWVMNTRSGAVSEYTNFAFNSFVKFGNKYLGASDTGLYELLGDDDDGTDITSQIKSGFAQWAGSKFTMFKAAYLAVRGGGDYVLKITTGDGKSYSYSVSARNMRSTKINIGKGIRTRYFAFELISDGDDYDLESLEFVPIVTDRRV